MVLELQKVKKPCSNDQLINGTTFYSSNFQSSTQISKAGIADPTAIKRVRGVSNAVVVGRASKTTTNFLSPLASPLGLKMNLYHCKYLSLYLPSSKISTILT